MEVGGLLQSTDCESIIHPPLTRPQILIHPPLTRPQISTMLGDIPGGGMLDGRKGTCGARGVSIAWLVQDRHYTPRE